MDDRIVSPGDLLEVVGDCLCQDDIRAVDKMYIEVKHTKPQLKSGSQVFFIGKINNKHGEYLRVNYNGHIYTLLESQLKPR